jgi:hypothetical protein
MKSFYSLAITFGLMLAVLSGAAQERQSNAANSKALEPGTYQVRNQKFKDLLRPRDANNADGVRIVLYSAQPWKCMTWRLRTAGEATFRLQNLFTSKTISADSKADQAKQAVVQAAFDAESGPAWQFTKLEDGSYKITESKSGKALSAVKAEDDNEAKIIVEPWRNEAEQKWELRRIDPKGLTM